MAGRNRSERITVSLACENCKSRNYRTTKKRDQPVLQLRKFCKTCGCHTLHQETK